jgi:hypothetical protein
MPPKEKMIESICKMLSGVDESQVHAVYQFVLHLTK